MGETKENMAKVAARYWKKRLEKRPNHNDGSSSMKSVISGYIADMASDRFRINSIQLNMFEECLIDEIIENDLTLLKCEYRPDEYLAEAAGLAGIDESVFPWMERTEIKDDCIIIYKNCGPLKTYSSISEI